MTKPQLERLMVEIHRVASGDIVGLSDLGRFGIIQRLSNLNAGITADYADRLLRHDAETNPVSRSAIVAR